MTDVEPIIRDELQRLAPLDPVERDWQDALDRAHPARLHRRRRIAFAAAAVLVCAVLPAVAFSAGLRGFLGLGSSPTPDLRQATLRVSAQLPRRRVARLWTAPSTGGGACLFATYGPASARPKAKAAFLGGGCSTGPEPLKGKSTWNLSLGSNLTPVVIDGRITRSLHPIRVELRWHGGSLVLRSKRGYFIGFAPVLANPPFRRLPYDLVAFGSRGEVSYRTRIPTSFLYRDWKQVQPRLRAYRVAHGCSRQAVWSCRTR